MKITAVETSFLTLPYHTSGGLQFIAGRPAAGLNMVLVRLETDAGIVGWGEAFGHAVAAGTKTALDTLLAPMLIGRDPADIGALMLDLSRKVHLLGRSGPVMYGLSGIDIALWDIAGKVAGLPIYKLLGGKDRRDLPAYSSLLRCTGPDAVARACRGAVESGFRHIKLHEITEPAVKAARDAVGPDVELMLDTNCPWTIDEAIAMTKTLAPYRLYWLEEPIWPPEDYEGLARVRAAGAITSCGENAGSVLDFRRMFELKAVAIAQPSVTKIGGISEMQRIIALGRNYGVPVVPHCGYLGAGFLATLHITAAMPDDVLVERLNVDLAENPYKPWNEIARGRASIPQAPGLGCDPDPDIVARYRTHPPNVVR
jgi:L-alanine-DL-glutamate epimerase-like enolase superfamily enzyme